MTVTAAKSHRPRLVEVARFAGVSSATASRALTRPQLLSPATLAKVNRAIDALGYVSDASARTLASGRSGMIGAVVPTIHNAVFARAIHHLQMGLAEAGRQLVLAAHEYNPALEAQAIRLLLNRGVDALVLVGAERPSETWDVLRGHRARIFLTYTFHDDYDSIGFDNAKAGYLAARHLIELGHRSIGFISGPRRCNDRMALRLKGAVDAMAEAGLELPPELVTEQEFSLSGGKLGAIQLMGLARPPTAILASNDLLAAGALHELSERGIDVPGNISVIGMENLDITGFTRPKLTSIHLPTEEIGTATAHHILARLRGEDVPRRVEFQVALVIRHSTGPTPRAV